MQKLFLKEFSQGRPVLIFSAAAALLVPALCRVLTSPRLLYLGDTRAVLVFFGFAVLFPPVVIALFASAGLFASEVEAGTLPVLLGLPLSRLRIWLAKLLAALALTALGSAAVLAVGFLLMRPPWERLPVHAYAADLCLWVFSAVCVGAFASILARTFISGLAGAFALLGLLTLGAGSLWHYLGAPILGVPPELDVALWVFFTTPALLAGSAFTFSRGELLDSRRKWLLALPVLLVGSVLPIFPVCAVTRWAGRYHRSHIRWASDHSHLSGGSALTVTATADARRLNYPRLRGPDQNDEFVSRGAYVVALDLDTGDELLQFRRPLDRDISLGVSPDGKYAAVLRPPIGLTWGPLPGRDPIFEVIELSSGRVLHSGLPDALKYQTRQSLHFLWSPSGEYLMFLRLHGEGRTHFVMKLDGSPPAPLPVLLDHAVWSPTEDVLYGLDVDGRLRRITPDGEEVDIIWRPEGDGSGMYHRVYIAGVSPDGKWVAVSETGEIQTSPEEKPVRTAALRVVSASGDAVLVPWQAEFPSDSEWQLYPDEPTWSGRSNTLSWLTSTWSLDRYVYHLYRWTVGEPTPVLATSGVELPVGGRVYFAYARPKSDEVVLWGERLLTAVEEKRPRGLDTVLVVDAGGAVRTIPSPRPARARGPPVAPSPP